MEYNEQAIIQGWLPLAEDIMASTAAGRVELRTALGEATQGLSTWDLARALVATSAEDWEFIELRYLQTAPLNYKKIAQRLGMRTTSAVNARRARVLRRLILRLTVEST